MKRPLIPLLVLASLTAWADDSIPIDASLLPATPQPPWEASGFGGQSVRVRVAIEAPLGSRLDVKIGLYQLAQPLVARVGAEVPIAEKLGFSDRTRSIFEASIPLPDVQRVTRFIGSIQARKSGTETWESAGRTVFVAYPPDLLDPLRRSLAQLESQEGLRLGVFGPSRQLRSFFKQEKIPFLDLGVELPAAPNPKVIHLGEVSMEKLRGKLVKGIRLITFDPEPSPSASSAEILPGIYASARDGGFVVSVTLNLLHDIAISPLAQESFARIFDQVIFEDIHFQ